MTRATIAAAVFFGLAAPAAANDEPAWAEPAKALVPQGYVAGLAFPSGSDATTGYIAVYPASANDPKTPLSTFAPKKLFAVTLEIADGEARPVSGELIDRDPAMPAFDEESEFGSSEVEFAHYHSELLATAPDLPPGTEPCAMSGWSTDPDPNGLNVRAEPSTKAEILGTLPPPFSHDGENWLTEFYIIGYRDGWFLIEGAEPPGFSYSDPETYPKDHPVPYAGRGWVAASKVGGALAYGGTRPDGLFQAPHADALWMPATDDIEYPLETGGHPKRLFACSGYWALVESGDGVVGWWRGLCSNQVTNCS
jgi:hypothetical protein